jgi:hypothetical protein
VNVTSAFWTPEADLGGQIPFQISLSCDENVYISELKFSSIQIAFSDDRPDVTLIADGTGSVESFIDLGVIHDEEITKTTGPLVWKQGQRVVLNGKVQSDLEGDIKVSCT